MTEDAVAPDRPGLREYARVLRRRWFTGSFVLLTCVGLALAYSLLATPSYLATADVLIEPSGAEVSAGAGARIDGDEVATQTQVVTSLPVARLVQERLSLAATPDLTDAVSVQAVGTSRILRITAQDTDAQRAADTANTVSTAYLQFREQDSVGRYKEARDQLAAEQSDVESRLVEVTALLRRGDGDRVALQTERRSLLNSLTQISAQTDSLSDSLTAAASGGELLRKAETPGSPVSPQTTLNLVLGALVGLVLGIGAALLRDRLDDVVHEVATVRQALGGVVVGRVPQWSERANRDRLVTLLDPHSPASEEYQRLAVNLRFLMAAEKKASGAIVLCTSGQEGEGKTVTSCNLAVAAARLGLRVVLVDADLRRAEAARRFGMGDLPGLSDLLVREDDSSTYLVDVGIKNLMLLPAGTLAPNPAALLGSVQMRLALDELLAGVDLLVLDSPPVLRVADTLELATQSDIVVVVTREGLSRRRDLVAVRETLRTASIGSVGVVYNSAGDASRASYGYARRERATQESAPAPPATSGPSAPDPSATQTSGTPGG